MFISSKDWTMFVKRLSLVNKKAADDIRTYIEKNGLEDIRALIGYCYETANHYRRTRGRGVARGRNGSGTDLWSGCKSG